MPISEKLKLTISASEAKKLYTYTHNTETITSE